MNAADGVVGVQRGREAQRRVVVDVFNLQPLLQAIRAYGDLQHAHVPADQWNFECGQQECAC